MTSVGTRSGRCSRCYGAAEAKPLGPEKRRVLERIAAWSTRPPWVIDPILDPWWHTGPSCHERVFGPWAVFEARPPVRREAELALPEHLVYALDALQTIGALWPVLVDALQPGEGGPTYTRVGDNQAAIDMRCPGCGAERAWRPPTFRGGWIVPPDGVDVDQLPPAPPARLGLSALHLGDVERLRPFCPNPECDTTALAPSPAPTDLGALEALVEVELSLLHAERLLRRAAGEALPPPGHPIGRLSEMTELLDLARRRRPLLFDRVEERLLSCARAVTRALRDVERVVRIPAPCPWCSTRSLVMYPERGLQRVQGEGESGLVVCTFGECECPDASCRCRHRGWVDDGGRRPHGGYRHQWTNDEWDRLSVLIDVNLRDLAKSA